MERQQAKAWVLAIALFTAPAVIGRLWPDEHTAADARRLGWASAAESADIAHDVFHRVNDERAARGLPPLVWHAGLAEIAGRWSEHMLVEGDYRHSDESFRQHPDFYGTAENIAMRYGDSGEIHVGWMESEGHRHNILAGHYDAIGIGIVCRGDGRIWGTQIFGVLPVADPPRPPTDLGREPVVRRDAGLTCPSRRRFLP